MKSLRTLVLLGLMLTGSSTWAALCGDEIPSNPCFRASEPIDACTAQLKQNPASTSTRIALCEALAMEDQLDQAEVVISQGIARCSGRDCRRLRLAMSYIEEKRTARDRADPREAERKQMADRRFCLTPFNNERSSSACERLLLSAPDDAEVYAALISKLLNMGDPSAALAYALQGRSAIGDNTLFGDLVADANGQRKAIVDDCLGDTSLQKCEQAYLAGAGDEYQVLRRRGELLTAAGQYDDAKQALDAARRLRPNDTQVRQALVALDNILNPAPTPTVDQPVEQPREQDPIEPPVIAAADPQPADREPVERETVDRTPEAPAQEDPPVLAPVNYRNTIADNGTSL